MTKRLRASPLTLLFFRLGIALLVIAILTLTLYGDRTARVDVDVNLNVGTAVSTVEVAAQAAQIQSDSSAVTNATNSQVINHVPHVTQNALFYAMLQNGVQPRNEASTSTLGDL